MRFEGLQKVTSALSQERSLEVLFRRIAEELGHYRDVALARLWMVGPSAQCGVCCGRSDGDNDRHPLHLRASAGGPLAGDQDWSRLDGDYHCGGVKEQQINELGTAILIREMDEHAEQLQWVRREQIRSFAGYPLIFGGEQLGVIAVFTRTPMSDSDFEWVRVFAVAMAGAIANARAFDEIGWLRHCLESESRYPRDEANPAASEEPLLGSSAVMRRVLEQIEMVAPTDATVLIEGETGVGKELVARAVHRRSRRRNHPLVNVNCTAIPQELFESIFFGHVMGAYSGATTNRVGRFQLAHGGSLLLDEVGDMPVHMQPKLLRVLQDGKFEPVGSEKTLRADVRIIAASNRDMRQAIGDDKFRRDLYYRLSVFPIEVPPLRERKEDIPLLASHFAEAACCRFRCPSLQLTSIHIQDLQRHDWPGNVRELQNVIERAVITSRLGLFHIDIAQSRHNGSAHDDTVEVSAAAAQNGTILTDDEMKRRERENVAAALRLSGGRIYGRGGAAELLEMKPTTLNARIKKFGLSKLV